MMNSVERDPEKLWKEQQALLERSKLEEHTEYESIGNYFSFLQHFKIQLVFSVLIIIILLAANYFEHPQIEKIKGWIKPAFHESFDFVGIANWYELTFESSPSFIPQFGNKSKMALSNQTNDQGTPIMPVQDGVILHTFAELLNGIEFAGEPGASVYSIDKGRVILVPPQQDSVIIQHANGLISIYSNLHNIQVEVSDWVEGGSKIGVLANEGNDEYSMLFFAMKRDDQYIDPLEVISIE